mgnify:CR=1 FL=1
MDDHQTLPQDLIDEFVGNAHGNLARVQELLTQYPALLNAHASWDETALAAAAQVGRRDIAEYLLAAGAPLDICAAAMLGQIDAVTDFLRADPALAHATGAHGIPLLYHAAITNHIQVAGLLLTAGADVNQGRGVTTALHGAAQFDQASMAAWLLEHGADPSAHDREGQTPLEVATAAGHDTVVSLIQRYGARD